MQKINQFRDELYAGFKKRADGSLDLIDALASAQTVESAVEVSMSAAFRRGYSSVYDTLDEGEIEDRAMGALLYEHQPEGSEEIGGYEIYAGDATDEGRAAAKTLADRTVQKSQARVAGVAGHKYQWLVRLVTERKSWVAPQAVERVNSSETANTVAARQVQSLDQRSPNPKVVVVDSGYVSKAFLAVFIGVMTVVLLIRLRSNQCLYRTPGQRVAGKPGRPAKHGVQVKLRQMPTPDREQQCEIRGQRVILQAWVGLHLKCVAELVGMVVCVTFLNADGTPKFKRPLWLFWTGASHLDLYLIARMYLWRFCIEHFFRFMKQHLGLCACNVVSLQGVGQWMRLCLLAYWQLLLAADLVLPALRPWRKPADPHAPFPFTPRQVQLALACLLCQIGTPAVPPRPAGKPPGRPMGFRPMPKTRHPVIYKSKKTRSPPPRVT